MKLVYLIPIVIAIAVYLILMTLKRKLPVEKFRRVVLGVGITCAVVAAVAIFMSYQISGDKTQLYKLALPAVIFVILGSAYRRNKKNAGNPDA